jgi:hypothetical protein
VASRRPCSRGTRRARRIETLTEASTSPLAQRIARDGYAFVAGAETRALLGPADALADWDAFAASWNDLVPDAHMPDGHRYRRRRHATLSARAGGTAFAIEAHQPHYQSLDYNKLLGGIERWFEPIERDVLAGATFGRIVGFCQRLFGELRPGVDWHIECHQFRIEARADAAGQPTPEGMHRDGVDYVLVLLVNRANIESGTTTVHDIAGHALGRFTLAAACDAALVDDARVMHGVTAVRPVDPARAAYRDVLVVTFRARPST